MQKLFIPIIEGTTRPKRNSIHVAKLIHKVAQKIPEIESMLIEPGDFNTPFDGNDDENKDPKYTDIVKRADAFMLVIPEYNHSFPGTLKRLLDSELKLYNHKPVAMTGVSVGPWGGVRAIESFVPVARELGLVVTSVDVQFPFVSKVFNENGELQDEKYIDRIKRCYAELIWMAKTLQWGRKNITNEQ